MVDIIMVFAAQMTFGFFRNLNTRYVSKGIIRGSLLTGFVVKSTWLAATYLGITSLIDGEYIVTVFYLAGGVLGDWISFKIKVG